MFSVNVEGTRIVLEEALRADVQRVVYTSSVAAIGPARAGRNADETNVWEAGRYAIPYLDAKHEAEIAALRLVGAGTAAGDRQPGPRAGRRATRAAPRPCSCAASCAAQIPAYVDGTLNIVGVEDVARGHLLADERGRGRRALHPRQPQLHHDRLFADLGRLSGVEPPAVKLPLPVALALASAGQRLRRRLPTPDRGAGRLAELGLRQPQGQARARLEDLAARGLPGGDDRVVPRRDGEALAPPGLGSRWRCAWPAGRCAASRSERATAF